MTASDVATATPQAQDGKSCPNSKEASPVKVKTPAEVQEEATTCLVTGKRHLLVSDIPAAVTILAKACELLSTQFGETAKECAESYFYYGKALLELSRIESGVLGNALDGVPEEDDEANNSKIEDPEKMTEEEKSEVEEKVTEALEENLESLQKKDEKTKEDGKEAEKEGETKEEDKIQKEEVKVDGKKEENKVEDKKEEKKDDDEKVEDQKVEKDVGAEKAEESSEKPSSSESKDSEATEEESMDEGEEETESAEDDKPAETDEKKEGEDEEPSNLQLAWEMLELAKVVYIKQIETEEGDKTLLEERLCSSILALGEVSLENENYSQAVEDIKLCLEKQKNLPKDSRLVAETHYQLGVAQGFNAQYDEAVESLTSAITIIKEKIKNLNETHKTLSDEIKKEISELEALVPEIEEKIADTKDMKKEAESKPKEGEEGFSAATKDATKSVSTIAVKRKAEDDGTDAKIKKVAAESEKDAEKTAAAV